MSMSKKLMNFTAVLCVLLACNGHAKAALISESLQPAEMNSGFTEVKLVKDIQEDASHDEPDVSVDKISDNMVVDEDTENSDGNDGIDPQSTNAIVAEGVKAYIAQIDLYPTFVDEAAGTYEAYNDVVATQSFSDAAQTHIARFPSSKINEKNDEFAAKYGKQPNAWILSANMFVWRIF